MVKICILKEEKVADIIGIGYFLVGLVTIFCIIVHDMRGEEFDPKYFGVETVFAMVITLLCGYLAPLLVWIAYISDKPRKRKYRITKLLHKLSNIGIKKDLE
jgi:hypothetical protein